MEMLSCKLSKLLTYKGNDSCCQLTDPCVDKDLKDHSSHLVLHFHKEEEDLQETDFKKE